MSGIAIVLVLLNETVSSQVACNANLAVVGIWMGNETECDVNDLSSDLLFNLFVTIEQ